MMAAPELNAKPSVDVIKLNHLNQETWRYSGHTIERRVDRVILEALFNRDDIPFHGIVMARGDRFVEAFYSQRWYNIFEIHDQHTNEIKGWYCNVSMPAVITDDQVSYVDLALDLLVYTDGHYLVLDEDEFQALPLDQEVQNQANSALQELITITRSGLLSPFMI